MDRHELAVISRGSRLTRVIWVTCLGAAFIIGAATIGLAHPGNVAATLSGGGSVLIAIAIVAGEFWPPRLTRFVIFVATVMAFCGVGIMLRTLLRDVLGRVG